MKKLTLALLCICFCFNLSACGEKKEKISDQYVQYSKKIIEISDQFLDYDLSADEAHDKLKELTERESELTEAEPGTDEYFAGSTIQNCTWRINMALLRADTAPSAEHNNTIKDERNKLAELIGEKKR